MEYLLAIDAGTGSIRAILFDILGNQIEVSQKEWVHLSEDGVPNSMSFDFDKNWELCKYCIRDVIQKANINVESIVALSAASMREGIILYDKDGNAIWGVANVDARASTEVKYIKNNFPMLEEEFYKISGQTFALGAIPRLLWLKNNRKDIYDKVAIISMIGDWILAKLSGIIATDPSNAGTTGIFSLRTRDWENSMASKVGLKDDIFCPCNEVGTVIGYVCQKASEETLLSIKTKVVTGGGDVQLGSAGLGITEIGDVAVLGGSFWQQIVNIPKELLPPSKMDIRVNPHVISNQSQAEGITFFSGLIMRWFRDVFCELEIIEAKEKNIDPYTLLEDKSASIPIGSYGILPIFSDSMNYKNWYHASPSFINLSIDSKTCNKFSMFKSLQENACIISKINLSKISAFTKIKIDTITFAGGASKGNLWSQTLADVTGCIVKVPTVKEATALGAAMSAAVGAGIFTSIKEASKELVTWEKEYIPNKKNTIFYDEIIARWEKVYKEQLNLVNNNLAQSMWKAPGL